MHWLEVTSLDNCLFGVIHSCFINILDSGACGGWGMWREGHVEGGARGGRGMYGASFSRHPTRRTE